MASKSKRLDSEVVLILAPFGRDSALIQRELASLSLATRICDSVLQLCQSIREGAGVALVADEALDPGAVEVLATQLRNQPPWSNLPVLVMTAGGAPTTVTRYRLHLLDPLGSVALLERPLRPETLASSVRAALRARRHQYQLRGLFAEIAASNAELIHTNQELSRANRELEEFAFVSSHDLQEPLRMVNIYTQLILNATQDENGKVTQYRQFVREGIERMEALIHDLLNFSRTIQQDEKIPATVTPLTNAFDDACAVLRERIAESGAVIHSEPLPHVYAEAAQLSHVFQNLLSNSIKYRHPQRPVEIRISAEAREGFWVISFRDNGIGFEQQYAQRIFGLFKRLHKNTYPGTGLGLAICQRIVERHGGRIWAIGRPAEGATFFFSLPQTALK